MNRIMRMMMARTGKIPKEQTDFSDGGFVFRVTVQDDYEFEWFKDVSIQVFEESSVPLLKQICGSGEKASEKTDNAAKKRPGSSTDTISEGAKRRKTNEQNLESTTENNESEGDDEDDALSSEKGDSEDEELDNEDEEWESEDEHVKHAIGRGFARLISRGRIQNDFWKEMEEPSQDTMALAFDLFDRYGFIRPEFVTGARCGSGIWGTEVHKGDFLHIEIVTVNENYRRQGLAKRMLKYMHEKAVALRGNLAYSFAWPTQINSRDLEGLSELEYNAKWTKGHNAAVELFRKVGYRRIGTSKWFAFAFDPAHGSHHISHETDYDPTEFSISPLDALLEKLERTRTQRPFGTAMFVLSDQFKGYSDENVRAIFELRGQEVPDQQSLAFLRAKFGCTCGECLGGFISPTMQHTLLHQAKMQYDHLEDLAITLRELDMNMNSDEDVYLYWPGLEHLPKSVRPFIKSNKSVAEGYRMMFQHICVCLKRKIVPNIVNVLGVGLTCEEWPPYTKNFLDKGYVRESITAVLKALFDWSRSQDEKAGDGMFMEFLDPLPGTTAPISPGTQRMKEEKERAESKPCRNDSEFGFVLGLLLQNQGGQADLEAEEE